METLSINKSNALKAFREADEKGKSLLKNLLGNIFKTGNIMDRVKTFEDACEETGDDPSDPKFHTGDSSDIADQKLKVIAKALREGVILSYADSNQQKWYPWFRWEGSGFRFDVALCVNSDACAGGGSRHQVDTEEKAIYFGKQFIDLHNDLLK